MKKTQGLTMLALAGYLAAWAAISRALTMGPPSQVKVTSSFRTIQATGARRIKTYRIYQREI